MFVSVVVSGVATPGPGGPGPGHQNFKFEFYNYIFRVIDTCQVCLFEMAFQKRSKGRQRTMFDCLDVNPLDSSASKERRQQHSDETDEQEMQLVSNDIRTINDGFNSCM